MCGRGASRKLKQLNKNNQFFYGQGTAVSDLDFIILLKDVTIMITSPDAKDVLTTVFALSLAASITDNFKTMDDIFDDLKSSMSELRLRYVSQTLFCPPNLQIILFYFIFQHGNQTYFLQRTCSEIRMTY